MSLLVQGGSKQYNVSTKVEYHYQRWQILNDKKTLLEDFEKSFNQLADDEFQRQLVKKMQLANIFIHLLGYFHEQIAKLYLKIILESGKDFKESENSKPPNYTPTMTRLSNITWKEYPENKLKGFCPYEPLVRIGQLIDFPIEYFGEIEIADLCDLPEAPEFANTTSKDLYTRLLEVRPVMDKWESYYIELCKYIEALCEKLQRINSE